MIDWRVVRDWFRTYKQLRERVVELEKLMEGHRLLSTASINSVHNLTSELQSQRITTATTLTAVVLAAGGRVEVTLPMFTACERGEFALQQRRTEKGLALWVEPQVEGNSST